MSIPKLSRQTIYFISFLTVSSVFLILTSWSWRQWPDILVDFGHELYVPWQITSGKVLYRDIAFTMGPFSQYFNSLLFLAFGVSLDTLIFCNLIIFAIIIWVVYRIFDTTCEPLSTTIIVLVLMAVFGFSQYVGVGNYNYICPYRHEMTHGMLFNLLNILCFARFHHSRNPIWMGFSGILNGLTCLTKTEMLIAHGATTTIGIVLIVVTSERSTKRLLQSAGFFLCGFVLVIVSCLTFLSTQMTIGAAVKCLIVNIELCMRTDLTTGYPFYTGNMGLNDIPGNIKTMMRSAAVILAIGGVLFVLDRVLHRYFRSSRTLCIILFSGALYLSIELINFQSWSGFARALPLFTMAATIFFIGSTYFRRNDYELCRQSLVLSLWSVMSLALLSKMLLQCRLDHYGFVLAMPASLLATATVISFIPECFRRRDGKICYIKPMMIGIVVGGMVTHLNTSNFFYKNKELLVGSGNDRFVTYNPEANIKGYLIRELIDDFNEIMPVDATLMVIPEGVTINYLTKRSNPTPYYLLTPWEMLAFGGEDRILADVRTNAPDFIAVLNVNMREHGRGYFGEPGYGHGLLSWIKSNYNAVNQYQIVPYGTTNFRIDLYRAR